MNALNTYKRSPLHYASYRGHLTCVQILIAAGTLYERDSHDNFGDTPLADAVMCNHFNVAEYLLHSGAKMKNVRPSIVVPDWMKQIVIKHKRVMHSTLILKGILRKRFAEQIPKDIANLMGLYFWSTRLN
jgi:Ankyrin repeats (3 copies)